MSRGDEFAYLQIREIAELLRSRQVTSSEVTDAILARIDTYDTTLNSYEHIMRDAARDAARRADAEIAQGHYRGALHGVPVAVKDLADTFDAPTAWGGVVHRDYVPPTDATVVARLRAAGAVLTGKLRMTEGAYTENHAERTVPVNPWNPEMWTGSSSNGSGVATAAGLCFASLGSDTGGSIRLPASMCGVTGVKPTWGRVSRAGIRGLAASLDHVGPMTRSAADCAIVLGAIAGADPGDPTASLDPVPDYVNNLRLSRAPRVGVDRRLYETFDEPTQRVLATTEDLMRDLGWYVAEVDAPDFARMAEIFEPLCAAGTAVSHAELFDAHGDDYGPALAELIAQGRRLSATTLEGFEEERRNFTGRMRRLFQEVDLLLVPGMGVAPPSIEMLETFATSSEILALMVTPTAPFNLSGSPTITIPAGFGDAGTPISIQLASAWFDESLMFAAAHALQEVTDYHRHHPDLAGL